MKYVLSNNKNNVHEIYLVRKTEVFSETVSGADNHRAQLRRP